MISEHDEIEAKLSANQVSVVDFKRYMNAEYNVHRYEYVQGPDHYYESGPNVVRHRIKHNTKGHELTVKRRKSDGSTRDRLEVDLHFDMERTEPRDVETFLKATGFTKTFTLVKRAHIFWVQLSPRLESTFVIYDVQIDGDPNTTRRFIEIEAEKGSPVSVETAKRHVANSVLELRTKFKLAAPLNDSLWELYSGKRYQRT